MRPLDVLLLVIAAASTAYAAAPFVMTLDDAKPGELPQGWSATKTGDGPGSVWKVVADADGKKVLAQTSDQGPNRLFNVCVAESSNFWDIDLTVAFKAVAGKLDQGGGPVWRYKDANNYYVARMNPLEDNYRLYKVVGGKRTQLASADVKAAAGQWHTLRIVHKGDHIECYLNGKPYLDVKDDTFKDAGKIGLWTKADAQTHFADLRASEPTAEQAEADAPPPAPQGKTWKLSWQDEFGGNTLDTSKWDIPEYKRRDGYWSRKAITLDGNGHLVMSVLKDGDKYLDGCVRTRGKFQHSFGYYVARIQLQKQQGHWSAFWIMGDGVGKVGNEGRDGTEIDIMEKPWLDDRLNYAVHWDGYGKAHKSKGTVVKVPGVMEGWHTFGLWWKSDEYVFYVDGKETWRTNAGGVSQVPEYIKLSDEIGNWAGDITKATLPDAFLVDYVRVYDLADGN